MSMHKIPLTQLEEDGLRAHGLDIGSPSQLSDVFRHGIKWALEQTAPQPEQTALSAVTAERDRLREALEDLLGCPADIVQATVPNAGIEAAPPYQVVLDVSVSLTRWRKAKATLQGEES